MFKVFKKKCMELTIGECILAGTVIGGLMLGAELVITKAFETMEERDKKFIENTKWGTDLLREYEGESVD